MTPTRPPAAEAQGRPPRPGEALRGLALYLAVALPLAGLVFLWSADAFRAWHGTAACFRALPGGDGVGDRYVSVVLERDGLGDLEVTLPAAAFTGTALPACPSGVPPGRRAEDPQTVHKEAFRLAVDVGERSWPTPGAPDLVFPLLGVLLFLPIRNWLVTGAPFRLAGRVPRPTVLQARAGEPAPPRNRGSTGPPPKNLRGRHRRKRG